MTSTNHIKPSKTRKYVKKDSDFREQFSEAESDHKFKMDAANASDDYSAEGDEHMSDRELLRRFRTSLNSNILPELPEMKGYHLCWVPRSSNNKQDTVDRRLDLGYSVVKPEELPNYQLDSNRSGQTDGCISYNELILMKLPMRLYQLYMQDSHHTQPWEQERVIKQSIKNMEDKEGESLVRDESEMTGINSLARKVQTPNFY